MEEIEMELDPPNREEDNLEENAIDERFRRNDYVEGYFMVLPIRTGYLGLPEHVIDLNKQFLLFSFLFGVLIYMIYLGFTAMFPEEPPKPPSLWDDIMKFVGRG